MASLIALESRNFSVVIAKAQTVRIKVRYFAQAREITGMKEEQFQLPGLPRVQEAVSKIVDTHPRLGEIPTARVMVNGRMTDEDVELKDGDVLVLVPPIAGG